MRVLLQQVNNGHYFENPNCWTANIDAALDFHDSLRAIECAKAMKLTDVRVLVVFVSSQYFESVALPIGPALHEVRRKK